MVLIGAAALLAQHLEPLPAGKIRTSFRGPTIDGKKTRFVHVGDGISSHDFVLGFVMWRKGEILNAITVHSKLLAEAGGTPIDLVAWGALIDEYLPQALWHNPVLHKTTTLVYEYDMVLVECIERLMLTGSAWSQYEKCVKEDRPIVVYGQSLPEGLRKNDPLPVPLFTPTTKAPRGQHDLPLSKDEVLAKHPDIGSATHTVGRALDKHMRSVGRARYADRKFEFGYDPEQGYVLCDEVGTPDSSRIWRRDDTGPNDKDYIRAEAERLGIKKFDPGNPADVAAVQQLPFTHEFIQSAVALYESTPELITGHTLERLLVDLGMGG